MINTAQLLKVRTSVRQKELRPYAVTHHNRPGFIERQDGSWIGLPVIDFTERRQNKPKARRRLWNWLANVISDKKTKGAPPCKVEL